MPNGSALLLCADILREGVGMNNRIEREIYKLMLEEKADRLEAEYK